MAMTGGNTYIHIIHFASPRNVQRIIKRSCRVQTPAVPERFGVRNSSSEFLTHRSAAVKMRLSASAGSDDLAR